jgi:putative protein kinase ArgK-like GTPase of G3E family
VNGATNAITASEWITIGLTALAGFFTLGSGIFAFFMKREMQRFDQDRETIRRLDKESVTWEGLTNVLEQIRDERKESNQTQLRMHLENREDTREFKGFVRESLERLERKIDANDECQKDLADQVHGINLKFEVALKTSGGYTPPTPPGFNHRR